jgi:exopolyphosphatase/guanosine-5'-triphosphate,3'-diphosphate pyrophosphatase
VDKILIDPVNGKTPSEAGASTADTGKVKRSRRGKNRRHGKPHGAADASRLPSVAAPENSSPPSAADGGEESRKRKKRRRKLGNHEVDKPGYVDPNGDSDGHSGAGKKRMRARKRKFRGPQGRPLVPTQNAKTTGRSEGGKPQEGTAHSRPADFKDNRFAAQVRETFPSADMYAALDLGTNNCRLLIAQPTRPGQFRVVDAFSRIVRLGEGLISTGRLSDDAMDRAVDALRVCAAKLAGRQIRKMRLIATEACRAASNGEEFLARVTRETGLELEIISRETEARLAVSGCSSLVGRDARSVVLFDIGGGSSEIAVIRIDEHRSNRLANHITHWTSLPVGVVTLSERYGGKLVTPQIFSAMVDEVAGMLDKFECPPASTSVPQDSFYLIGTSGTVTTLAGVHLDLPRYDRRKVDGLWLSDSEVSAMQAKLLSWDFEARSANACIGSDRADLVLAGCAILEAIRRRWPSERMRVADRGLREGLLADMMADDGAWRRNKLRRAQHLQDAKRKA